MVGFSELILVIKFGLELFSQTQLSKMLLWIMLNIIVSILGVFASMKIYKWKHKKSTVEQTGKEDSSEDKVNKFLNENNFEISSSTKKSN